MTRKWILSPTINPVRRSLFPLINPDSLKRQREGNSLGGKRSPVTMQPERRQQRARHAILMRWWKSRPCQAPYFFSRDTRVSALANALAAAGVEMLREREREGRSPKQPIDEA
jgi:hypothetical protein